MNVSTNSVRSSTSWFPSLINCVKVNVDTHIYERNGVGLGVVIRDNQGAILYLM